MFRSNRNFPMFVSETLDCIGYNKNIVSERRRMYKEFAKKMVLYGFVGINIGDADIVIAGSKGEGGTTVFENDFDFILVMPDVVCVEVPLSYSNINNKAVFLFDRESSAPGYTKLKHVGFNGTLIDVLTLLQTFVVPFSQAGYFPSCFFRCLFEKALPIYSRKGPSIYIKNEIIVHDIVLALPCDCSSFLTEWLFRHRINNWPPEQTKMEVLNSEVYVVPVGLTHSPDHDQEWRISPTLAELALVHSFDDIQMKVYILLKFLAKSSLKPVCDGMTSYAMKNIMFWVCEWTPTARFTADLLVERLVQALQILYKFVKKRYLPNYMIPERNLLLGRLTVTERRQVLEVLGGLIDEGGCMLFRCGKLRDAMVTMFKTPEEVRRKGQRRDAIETLFLMAFNMVRSGDQKAQDVAHIMTILVMGDVPDILNRVLCGENIIPALLHALKNIMS